MSDEIHDALLRRALGFDCEETVDEYGFSEGEEVLVKRKVTKKYVPPDISAAKLLLEEKPQFIDYGVYGKALMKAANIADLEGKSTLAKYYRYKIHSIDIFVGQKVVYKNDIEIILDSFIVKKLWFKYKLRAKYKFKNVSNNDIKHLSADFVLLHKDKDRVLETVTKTFADKKAPLYSNGGETPDVEIIFGKNIFTKKELEQYVIDIYLYKDERYKTLAGTMRVPLKSIYSSK